MPQLPRLLPWALVMCALGGCAAAPPPPPQPPPPDAAGSPAAPPAADTGAVLVRPLPF